MNTTDETSPHRTTIDPEAIRLEYLRNVKNVWWDIGKVLVVNLCCLVGVIEAGMKGNGVWIGIFLACLVINIVADTHKLIKKVLTYQQLSLSLLRYIVDTREK